MALIHRPILKINLKWKLINAYYDEKKDNLK